MSRRQARSLYVHVPFCVRKCPYCAFYSEALSHNESLDRLVDSLLLELEQRSHHLESTLDTVYFGGGTPSLLGFGRLGRLLERLSPHFAGSGMTEVTLEVNPGALRLEELSELRGIGINRLSIGVQSRHDRHLGYLGRVHNARQAMDLIAACVDGNWNVSMDLMYGLPGQSLDEWVDDLLWATNLGVRHLSCYELTVEEGTPLALRHEAGILQLPDAGLAREFFLSTHRRLAEFGFPGYEVSSFASGPAFRSRHNLATWSHRPYLGVGPSAHSFLDGRRTANVRDVAAWTEAVRDGRNSPGLEEDLTSEQLLLERVMLGLRTLLGVDLAAVRTELGVDLDQRCGAEAKRLERQGLLVLEKNHWKPTLDGLAVADELPLLLL